MEHLNAPSNKKYHGKMAWIETNLFQYGSMYDDLIISPPQNRSSIKFCSSRFDQQLDHRPAIYIHHFYTKWLYWHQFLPNLNSGTHLCNLGFWINHHHPIYSTVNTDRGFPVQLKHAVSQVSCKAVSRC